eukprot:s3674_g6.t1
MSGSNCPVAKTFLYCGWRCVPVDWAFGEEQDLSLPPCQEMVREHLRSAIFVMAALDCTTKTRAREISRTSAGGHPLPRPLRSEEYPEGLPGLSLQEQRRVSKDNVACRFVLDEIQGLVDRGGPTAGAQDGTVRTMRFDASGIFYPSREEAEFTAPLAFAIAVSVSWWAARLGHAVLHVPRHPIPS